MANTVKIRRSGTTTSTPSSLDHGELAINYADDTLFWKDDANVIQSFVFQAYASATHKSSHATGGSDALTPSDIGAAPAASPTFTGNVGINGATNLTNLLTIRTTADGSSASPVYDGIGWVYRTNAPKLGAIEFVSRFANYGAGGLRFQLRNAAGTLDDSLFIDNQSNSATFGANFGIRVAIPATSGSAGSYLPSVCFASDANTGLGQVGGADTVSLITAGSERVRVKSTGAVRYVPLTGTDPTGEVGDFYYNSTMGTLRTYRGSSWVSVPPRPWDISNGVLTHEFSVAGEETQPAGIAFKPDGSKMYICGSVGDDVNEYDLATAWDISTATYLQNFSVSAKATFPTDVKFTPTGLKMYVLDRESDSVHEYDLSAAWDVASATFLQSFSVSSQEANPYGLVFKPDGLKFYICGLSSDSVHEYSMSTAWDISSATFSQSLSIAAQDTTSTGLAFRPDGLRMYMTGYATDTTNEYVLSTPWDISTATYTQRISIADGIPAGTAFSSDGTRMYVVGYSGQKVLQYWLA